MRRDQDKLVLTDRFVESNQDNETITFNEILSVLWLHKWAIVGFATAGFLIAAIYASNLTPIFQASALLQINQQSESVIHSDAFRGYSDRSPVSTEMRLMTSYPVLSKVIDEVEQKYIATPRYLPFVGAAIARLHTGEGVADPLLWMDEYAWGGEILELGYVKVTGEQEQLSSEWRLTTEENQGYSLWGENGEKILSGTVGQAASGNDNKSVIKILVSRLISRPGVSFVLKQVPGVSGIESLAAALSVHSDNDSEYDETGFIRLSMEGPNPEIIVTIVNAVARTYVEQNQVNNSKEVQQKLDFIHEQIPVLKTELDTAQRSLQVFRQYNKTVNLDFETQNALTQLNEYKKEISKLQLKKEDLKRRFTENHPEVIVVSRQIENIQEKSRETEALLHIIPEREWEYIQKTRDVELATDLYVRLLNMAQELRIDRAGVTGNAQITNPATMSSWPIKPNKSKIRMMGFSIGLLLGLTWIAIRRLSHNKVIDPVKLENETGLHVYAMIPHSSTEVDIHSQVINNKMVSDNQPRLLAFEKDTDLAIEVFRSFRTSMRFVMKTAENNVILIAGPSPSVGKSFFSSNYAAVAAKQGQRVLLIDADMRKGHLHNYLAKAISPGLSDLIANDIPLEETVHEVAENFFFITAGERPPNPAELLASPSFQKLFLQLQQHYDLVIVDTPPILAVTDASIIAQYTGHLFLLLRYGKHHMNEIHDAISLLEKSGISVTGLLFNDIEVKAQGIGYGYGYRYDYGYKE